MENLQLSKGEALFTTIGVLSGVIYSYKKQLPTNKLLLNSVILGLTGYLVGSTITKLYE